jgi:hypothetical protein
MERGDRWKATASFKDKARWEQMPLTAVIAEWWPDVWADLKVTS